MKNMKTIVAIGLISSITLLGCSKVNRESYDKIEIGMNYSEVISIIGEPDECDSALMAKSCTWGDENKNITIKFVTDKVVLPSMKGL